MWWFYPVLGQLLGGIAGGVTYELTIGIHQELDDESFSAEVENGNAGPPPSKDDPLETGSGQ